MRGRERRAKNKGEKKKREKRRNKEKNEIGEKTRMSENIRVKLLENVSQLRERTMNQKRENIKKER